MIPYAADNKQAQYGEVTEDPFYEQENNLKWTDKVLLNRPSKVVVISLITAIALPLLLYKFTLSSTLDAPPSDGYSFGSCIIPRETRLPCGPGNVSEEECHTQCCYDLRNGLCFHRLPSRFSYIMDRNWTEGLNLQPRVANEPFSFQSQFVDLQLSVDEVSNTHLTLSFLNSAEMERKTLTRLNATDYSYRIASPELNVQVTAQQGTIFNTNRGPLIAANNIWEISFKLTNESMFGLGEIPLRSGTVKVIYSHKGGFNSIPLIFAKSNGSYHGLLIDVEWPTEISIHGENQIVIRSIATSGLRFHLFVGPKPKDIMHDVMDMTGFENNLKYWMLGAHICNSEMEVPMEDTYENFMKFLNDTEVNSVPYESHCGLAPIVLNQDEVTTEMLSNGIAALEKFSKRFIPHVSPYIYYKICNDTIEDFNQTRANISNCGHNAVNIIEEFNDIMLQEINKLYIGSVNNLPVIYPDYGTETSKKLIERLWKQNWELEGIILENTWPLDESFKLGNETHLHFPYFNENFEKAFSETLPWNTTRPSGDLHLYSHNKYGNHFFSIMKDIFGENSTIYTSSQWMNGQAIINRQHIETSWANFRKELTEVALNSISGHWLQSSPICGDTEHFDPETQRILCVKWYQAASYLPLIKIHSEKVERHPLAFVGNNRLNIMEALHKRSAFLPHFYTVLQKGPLLRPMFFQFPNFEALENVTSQFSVGDELLIVPDFLPSQSHVNVWMPPGTWFELWSGLKLNADEGSPVTMASTEADFLTLIRGGSIIFMQKNLRKSAEETRLYSNYSITIALECYNHTVSAFADATLNCSARGSVYMTNDMSLFIVADSERISITAVGQDLASFCGENSVSASVISEISVYGLSKENNNYDHSRHLNVDIDLCKLQTSEEISFDFAEQVIQ